jgi:hypothetical protein
MIATIHAHSRNHIGNNNILLRHSVGSDKVQVCCASQEKYGIAQKCFQFHTCVNVVEVNDGGDGSVRE